MKYLVSVVETYRVDNEKEAAAAIEEAKKDTTYTLSKYTSEHKEVKAKGEVVDEYYKVQNVCTQQKRKKIHFRCMKSFKSINLIKRKNKPNSNIFIIIPWNKTLFWEKIYHVSKCQTSLKSILRHNKIKTCEN